MYYYIYKSTNLINNKYYIGRHASNSKIDPNYYGSGRGILSAIKKYGKENFKIEIIEYAASAEELWILEEKYVNEEVVKDPNSYNIGIGGKHWLRSAKKYTPELYIKHQRDAGIKGGNSSYYSLKNEKERQDWHSKGGKATFTKKVGLWSEETKAKSRKTSTEGEYIWHPNTPEYIYHLSTLDYEKWMCTRLIPNSEEYINKISNGWITQKEKKILGVKYIKEVLKQPLKSVRVMSFKSQKQVVFGN